MNLFFQKKNIDNDKASDEKVSKKCSTESPVHTANVFYIILEKQLVLPDQNHLEFFSGLPSSLGLSSQPQLDGY